MILLWIKEHIVLQIHKDSIGRSVLVTGAGSGIGLETALALQQAGFTVFGGIRSASAEEALKRAGVTPVRLDVTQPVSIQEAVETVSVGLQGSSLYALINNAGVAAGGPWEHVSIGALHSVFDVNFFGTIMVTQAFLPMLRPTAGRIVLISSVAGEVAAAFNGPYSASKGALESFADSLRRELRPLGVAVTSILPGPVATPLWRKFRKSFPPPSEQPPYAEECSRYLALTTKAETTGLHASAVAAAVRKVLLARNSPARIVLAPGGRFALRLQALLPERWQDYLMYGSHK
jgi:NAD(P)-dependent dehydrogenase (short-subunit alcohol dehydrogenase family)